MKFSPNSAQESKKRQRFSTGKEGKKAKMWISLLKILENVEERTDPGERKDRKHE